MLACCYLFDSLLLFNHEWNKSLQSFGLCYLTASTFFRQSSRFWVAKEALFICYEAPLRLSFIWLTVKDFTVVTDRRLSFNQDQSWFFTSMTKHLDVKFKKKNNITRKIRSCTCQGLTLTCPAGISAWGSLESFMCCLHTLKPWCSAASRLICGRNVTQICWQCCRLFQLTLLFFSRTSEVRRSCSVEAFTGFTYTHVGHCVCIQKHIVSVSHVQVGWLSGSWCASCKDNWEIPNEKVNIYY